MAGLIKREDIDEVRRRTDIKEIVEPYVALKTAGIGTYKGLCPFHDERSPSFFVRPQHGTYHCFGCGEGGDVISFLMKLEHTSFSETVERLAGRLGYELHYEDGGQGPSPEERGRRQRLLDAHKIAAEYFRDQLLSAEAVVARTFLDGRGFGRVDAEQFGVGYAPQGWDNMLKHLRSRGFAEEDLKLTGMFSESAGGKRIYDRFRGRLVWPIRNITGQTIGFGARKLYDQDEGPKYLNTPETPLYKKAQVLYGIDLARKSIAAERKLVVVEGYTDVMAAHLSGVENAVATCGTAFGLEHIRTVRRLLSDDGSGGEVIFTFDGDAAGQKAALRAFKEDQQFMAKTSVAIGPEGQDPNDLRLSGGAEAIRALIDSRRPLFEFAIKTELAHSDLDSAEGQLQALRRVAPIVAQIKDSSLRSVYTRQLSLWVGIQFLSFDQIEREVAKARKAGVQPTFENAGRERTGALASQGAEPLQAATTQFAEPNLSDAGVRVEHDIVVALLQYPNLASEVQFRLFTQVPMRSPVFEALRTAMKASQEYRGSGPDWAEHVRAASPEQLQGYVTQLAVTPLPAQDEKALGGYMLGLLRSLMAAAMSAEKNAKLAQMQRLDAVADAQEISKLNREIYQLELRRRELLEQAL